MGSGSVSPTKSPSATPLPGDSTPPEGAKPVPGLSSALFGRSLPDDAVVGSPLKKARPSVSEADNNGEPRSFPPALGDILAKAEAAQAAQGKEQAAPPVKEDVEEEL